MAKLIPLCLAPLSLSLPRFIILSLCPSLLSHLAPSSSPPSCPQDHFYLNFNCHSLLPPSPSVFTPLLYFITSSFAFLSVDNHPSFSHHLPIFDFASLAFFSLYSSCLTISLLPLLCHLYPSLQGSKQAHPSPTRLLMNTPIKSEVFSPLVSQSFV